MAQTGNSVNIKDNKFDNSTVNIYQGTSRSEQPNLIEFNLPPRVNIIGREKEVEELHQLLKEYKRVVICGMGGRGKTSLASHCARRWLTNKFIDHAAMIDSETPNSLDSSFRSLARKMKIKIYKKEPIRNLVDMIYDMFQNYKLLLIFDNVVTFSDIRPHLLQQLDDQLILITSQLSEYDPNHYEIFRLELLTADSSMHLIKDRLGKCWSKVEKELDSIKELCTTLQYHPLALTLAAAHISDAVSYGHSTFPVKQYAERYRDKLDEDFPDYYTDIYTKTVHKALNINIELLRKEGRYGDKALLLLSCMSYMDPSDLNTQYFLRSPEFNEDDLKNVIRKLEKYSIATVTGRRKNYLNIHRLILETCRNILKLSEEDRKFQKTTLKLLLAAGRVDIHADFIISEMELDIINDCYKEYYSSGPQRKRLTKELEELGYDHSTVEYWTGIHYAAFIDASMIQILAKHISSRKSKTNDKQYKLKQYIIKMDRKGNNCLHLLMMGGWCYGDDCERCCTVLLLIEHGDNTVLFNSKGETVFHIAAQYGHTHILQLGYNKIENIEQFINLKNMEGNDCLHLLIIGGKCNGYCCRRCNYVVKLIEHGGNIGVSNKNGETIFHMAAQYEHILILKSGYIKIAKFEQSINLRNMEGNNCLHLLMMGGECNEYDCERCVIVLYFITRGCDAGVINKNGLSAVHVAAQYKHVRVLELLLRVCSTERRSEYYYSIVRVAEKQHILLFKQTSQNPDLPAWYRWISLDPLVSTEEGVELLQRLTQDGQAAPRTDYEQVVRLLNNVPLGLRMAVEYMRYRTMTITDFIQHFNAIPDDDLYQSMKQYCSGYTCDALCKLICIVINNLIREHGLMLILISHLAFISEYIPVSDLYDLLHTEKEQDITECVELLGRWSLLEIESKEELWFFSNNMLDISDLPEFRLHELVACIAAIYAQQQGTYKSICSTLITNDIFRLDKSRVIRYLGCSGVHELYMEELNKDPAAVQAEVDDWTDGMRVLDVGDLERWTALHCSALSGNGSMTWELLLQGAPVDATAHDDITPLHLAALHCEADSVKMLCEYGANVNARTAQDGLTPLHLAACTGVFGTYTDYLIQYGGDVDAGDKENNTPAHMAALRGWVDILQTLSEYLGADMSKKNNAGYSPEMVRIFFESLPNQ